MHKIRRYFFSGIALVLPIVITVYILMGLFRFTDGLLGRYINYYFKIRFGYTIPGLGLVIFLLIILFSGFIAANFLGKKLLRLLESWFLKMPLVSKIYPHIKQFVGIVLDKDKTALKKVVLVEYPRKGVYSLGFITNERLPEIEEKAQGEIITVLIPSVPNPYSGYFFFFKKEEVIYLDMSVEDAIKLVVSGGVLQP